MRRILYTLAAVAALLLAAEVGVTLVSQYGMERALRSQYELPGNLEVSINSFPFLVSLARNHVSELRLDWQGEVKYQAAEGMLDGLPCRGGVSLYDVELDMPALLTGRLELKRILRQEAELSFSLADLGTAVGLQDGDLTVENAVLCAAGGGEKTQYEVKVAGDSALVLSPRNAYTPPAGSWSDPEEGVKSIVFHSLPMGARLLNASLNGERVYVEISIPWWEGYL